MRQAEDRVQLSRLLEALPTVLTRVGGDVEIHGITADSRHVEPGDIFVAIPGLHVDGHRFIPQAVEAGAAAVVGERAPRELPDVPWDAFTYVRVPDAREAWGWLCAAWHDFPSREMTLIGVTGTDGKTTTVTLIHAILRAAGLDAGMAGTVSARVGEEEIDTGLHTTTPDPPELQRYLAQMVRAGASHAVLEVTSHGLAQHRVAGCDFDVAAVTNVTREHLDFHRSLAAYRRAKARLFEGLTDSFRKRGVPKVAVLNRYDASYEYLNPIPADRRVVYGVKGPQRRHRADGSGRRSPASALPDRCDVVARGARFAPDRTRFTLCAPAGEAVIETQLVGAYNVSNILAAAAVGVALHLPLEAMVEGVESFHGVPGRMERIEEGQDFLALVDFAHTPNALRRALRTSRTMTGEKGRVIVVFGCAGLRDRGKRTSMGQVAGELADVVILTAEDPRTESLEGILAVSAASARETGKREGVDLFRVPDRGEAVLRACEMSQPGDVVIACGKGHERSMCFGVTEYPWDDREAMRLALHGETLDTLPTAGRTTPQTG